MQLGHRHPLPSLSIEHLKKIRGQRAYSYFLVMLLYAKYLRKAFIINSRFDKSLDFRWMLLSSLLIETSCQIFSGVSYLLANVLSYIFRHDVN